MRSPQPETPGAVGSWPWRVATAALLATAGLSLPYLLVLVLAGSDPPVTPPILFKLFLVASVLPALAWHLALRTAAASISIGVSELVLRRHDVTIEVPARAIARIVPWSLPLPLPGFSIQLRSGQWLRYGVAVADPHPLLRALAEECDCEAAGKALAHPMTVWAHARARYGGSSWNSLFVKFIVFGLAPTVILFNAHQHISYGGLFGQFHLEGAWPWLRTLLVYWASLVVYLVLYAGVARGIVEALTMLAAWARPSAAGPARVWAERALHAVYYGGVPLLVGLRFLDW